MPLISGKELNLLVNHGSCILHLVDFSASYPLQVFHSSSVPLFLPILPTSSHRILVTHHVAVCTMEVPTKWSRASVISFIKGLGKHVGVCVHVTAQVSHKQVAVCEAWDPVVY